VIRICIRSFIANPGNDIVHQSDTRYYILKKILTYLAKCHQNDTKFIPIDRQFINTKTAKPYSGILLWAVFEVKYLWFGDTDYSIVNYDNPEFMKPSGEI